jgi:hypothetical protein
MLNILIRRDASEVSVFLHALDVFHGQLNKAERQY